MTLFQTLNSAGARYVIIGGLASLLHGVGHTTTDVGIRLDLAADSILPAIGSLSARGYRPTAPVNLRDLADAQIRTRWQRDNAMVEFSLWGANNRQPTFDVMLDPVVAFPELWRDALLIPVSGTPLRIASIAHLIQMKRHAGRPQDARTAPAMADSNAPDRLRLRRLQAAQSSFCDRLLA